MPALLTPSAVATADGHRPRVALVLGGGGARGAAHIGVLEVLEELRVPVDCVAGTSMGALVAGVFAAGMGPQEMKRRLAAADWKDLFIDNPEYAEMSHRNKVVSRRYQPGSETGVTPAGFQYQSGVVAGQKIKLFFNDLVRVNQGERSIEDLSLPLSIIATDIATGERVVFRNGPLSMAMRASMSVPGLLSPVDYQGKKLVDGGLVDNVPLAEARQRCQADVAIVVNVGSPLLKADEVGSLLSVSAQMVNILTEQNVQRTLATLRPTDIYLQPDLEGITAGDFPRNAEAAARGRAAAEKAREQLAALAVPAEHYQTWWAGIRVDRRDDRSIGEIEIAGLKAVSPDALTRHLTAQPGERVSRTRLGSDLGRVYGDGWYERVDYSVLREHERDVLRILPVEKPWGPNYLRLGLALEADRTQSSFALRGGYHATWLNTLGGELLVNAEIGSHPNLSANFYQPLTPAHHVFVESTLAYGKQRQNLYEKGNRIAQYGVLETRGEFYGGVHLGRLGPLRLGWLERRIEANREIGDPQLPETTLRRGGLSARFDLDQFDRMFFPTRGWAASAHYFRPSGADYSRFDATLGAAAPVGRYVLNARFGYTGSPTSRLGLVDAGAVGGPFNLSALTRQQVLGDDIVFAGLRAERIIGVLPLGLRGDMRLGISFEGARIGRRLTETQLDGLIDSTALYLGGETPFGPLYVGAGYSSRGYTNLFLQLGTP